MKSRYVNMQIILAQGMVWLGGVAAIVTWALRALLMPTLRDNDTGRFATSTGVVAALVVVLAVLAIMGARVRTPRVEIGGRWAVLVSLAAMAAGGVMLLSTLWDVWQWLAVGKLPPPDTAMLSPVARIAMVLTFLFGILGGAALLHLGMQLTAEGSTRRGMLSWSALGPVMWIWFRLARYEMSYASAVGLSETFYDFMLFIMEMLFLFKMARYVSGIGKVRTGSLLFFSVATAIFGLSGPLTRLCMYLLQDSEAYLASQLAGLPDFTIGVLGLVFAIALVDSARRTASEDGPPKGHSSSSALLLTNLSDEGSSAAGKDSQL